MTVLETRKREREDELANDAIKRRQFSHIDDLPLDKQAEPEPDTAAAEADADPAEADATERDAVVSYRGEEPQEHNSVDKEGAHKEEEEIPQHDTQQVRDDTQQVRDDSEHLREDDREREQLREHDREREQLREHDREREQFRGEREREQPFRGEREQPFRGEREQSFRGDRGRDGREEKYDINDFPPVRSPAPREVSPRSLVPEYEDYDVAPTPAGHSEGSASSARRVERLVISDADASFILGTGGRTKKKLARVSRAELSVTQSGRDNTVLEIKGSPEAIDRAKTYVEFVMQQRVGPVRLSPEVRQRNDLVILDIPHLCVGYVTGAKGQGLRSVEEEFATLMFFTDVRRGGSEPPPKTETLVIFSPCERARQGAVLKVMSAVEQKLPGHFTSGNTDRESDAEGFDVDIATVTEDDYSYALGRGGGTRKKLARASGAILEYIGRFAYIAGTKPQRQRARQYLKWLCSQRVGEMNLESIDERRDDMEVIDVPMDCVAYVTGQKGQALRRMEEVTNTFMFLDGSRGAPTEKLYIFGESASGRAKAKELAEKRIDEKITGASNYHPHRSSDSRRGPPSYYSAPYSSHSRDNGYGGRRTMSPPPRRGYYAPPPDRYRRPEYGSSSSASGYHHHRPSYQRRDEEDRRKRYRPASPYRPRHVDDFPPPRRGSSPRH